MNPDSENFDSLRRLLALKRHEQPPPGYFNHFSREVVVRIKAGESGGEMSLQMPFWERVLGLFDVKPVVAGAFGMGVCALLISGVVASENYATDNSKPTGPSVATVTPETPPVTVAMDTSKPEESSFPSTNAVSLFDQLQPNGGPQPVSMNYLVPQGN